jgi:hypothetical protein
MWEDGSREYIDSLLNRARTEADVDKKEGLYRLARNNIVLLKNDYQIKNLLALVDDSLKDLEVKKSK